MRPTHTHSLAAIALTFAITAHAQAPAPIHQMDHMHHMQPMPGMGDDHRQQVDFPPEMRQHTLANMRDHLKALSEILARMSGGDYARAGQIAATRLGMDSPSAEGCKAADNPDKALMSSPGSMDHQMSQFMPEGMRNIGLAMHQAASEFTVQANKAAKSGNAKPALAALAKVTQQCAACHASYKVQ